VLHVLAEIRLRPGARDAFVAEFRRLTPLVLAEDGCLEYAGALEVPTALAAQAPVRDDVFTVVEKWRDEAALAAHLAAPHMDEHRAAARELAAGTTIRVLRGI
jgi:quinol monooxygenase YgiN